MNLRLLLLLLLLPLPARADLVDRVVAVVNKEPILASDLEGAMEYVQEQELRGLAGADRVRARRELQKEVLDTLVGQQLLEQAMDRAEVEVEDRDVDAAMADVARQNGLTIERLVEEVAKQGMDEASYRVELKKQLRQYRFMEMNIRSRIEVTEADVRNRFAKARDGASGSQAWRLERILLALPADAAGQQTVREEAAVLLKSLQGGADFGEAAKGRSDDASTRERGGEVGLLSPGDLSPAFREALEAVPAGTPVSIELPAGIFLLRVAEVVDTAEEDYRRARGEIRRQLEAEAMERELTVWTEEEKRKAHVELLLDEP